MSNQPTELPVTYTFKVVVPLITPMQIVPQTSINQAQWISPVPFEDVAAAGAAGVAKLTEMADKDYPGFIDQVHRVFFFRQNFSAAFLIISKLIAGGNERPLSREELEDLRTSGFYNAMEEMGN